MSSCARKSPRFHNPSSDWLIPMLCESASDQNKQDKTQRQPEVWLENYNVMYFPCYCVNVCLNMLAFGEKKRKADVFPAGRSCVNKPQVPQTMAMEEPPSPADLCISKGVYTQTHIYVCVHACVHILQKHGQRLWPWHFSHKPHL